MMTVDTKDGKEKLVQHHALSRRSPLRRPTRAKSKPAGFKVKDFINLTPTGGLTEEMVQQSIKLLKVAAGGGTTGSFGDPSQSM